MRTIRVFTDASCDAIAGTSGIAAVAVEDGKILTSVSEPGNVSVNLAELSAIGLGLQVGNSICNRGDALVIHTDSNNCIGWLTKTFRTKNEQIFRQVLSVRDMIDTVKANGIDLSITKAEAHADDEFNNYADMLAGKARKSAVAAAKEHKL